MTAPWNGLPQPEKKDDTYWLHLYGPHDPQERPARFSYLKIGNTNPQRNDRVNGNGNAFPRFPTPDNADCTFHPFHQLPIELRYMIWWFAVCEPRLVEVHCVDLHCRAVQRNQQSDADPERYLRARKFDIQHFRSHTPIPPLLTTCKESRKVAVRGYSRCYMSNYFCSDAVYFDFEVDTAYISSRELHSWALRDELLGLNIWGFVADNPEFTIKFGGAAAWFWSRIKSIALDFAFIHEIKNNSGLSQQRHVNWKLSNFATRAVRLNHLIVIFDHDWSRLSEGEIKPLIKNLYHTIRSDWSYSRIIALGKLRTRDEDIDEEKWRRSFFNPLKIEHIILG